MGVIAPRTCRVVAALLTVAAAAAQESHGRIEMHGGLTLARVWGTPAERGDALGRLLGAQIHALVVAELEARYARRPARLDYVREVTRTRIRFPADVEAQLDAMLAGMRAAGTPLALDEFGRDIDALDLRLLNALDVTAVLGCSGFTASGERVAGGGVLTARSFDWPLLGDHLLHAPLLVVEHPVRGAAFAYVTWPGYLGAVSAVSEHGLAVFVHVGNGGLELLPKQDAMPTALCTRAILRAEPENAFAVARTALAPTAPPVSYSTRVVMPRGERPELVFEIDADERSERRDGPLSVTTNHFLATEGDRGVSLDSRDRYEAIRSCLGDAGPPIDIPRAWDALVAAQRGYGHAFPTLHALVFRAEPWCFELRLAERGDRRALVPAPSSTRRHVLAREELFRRP